MNGSARAFQITVWIGIVVNCLLSAAAILAPDRFLTTMGFDPSYPNIWPRFAGLLLILLSAFYAPGANDVHRYRANAVLQVVSRSAGVVFFTLAVMVLGFSTRFLLFAGLDLAFAVPTGILLWLAVRKGSRQPAAAAGPTLDKDVQNVVATRQVAQTR